MFFCFFFLMKFDNLFDKTKDMFLFVVFCQLFFQKKKKFRRILFAVLLFRFMLLLWFPFPSSVRLLCTKTKKKKKKLMRKNHKYYIIVLFYLSTFFNGMLLFWSLTIWIYGFSCIRPLRLAHIFQTNFILFHFRHKNFDFFKIIALFYSILI